MNRAELERVAALIAERNSVDAEIGASSGRPVVAGHLGEWIAAQVLGPDGGWSRSRSFRETMAG